MTDCSPMDDTPADDDPQVVRDTTAADTQVARDDASWPLVLSDVVVRLGDRTVLGPIDWRVEQGQHWVVLGPNGCGKTTLIRVAALRLHPSHGEVTVLGAVLGRTDLRPLRPRVGFASAAMADMLRPRLTAHEVVMTARRGALEPWWDDYDDDDRRAASRRLTEVGAADLAGQTFGSLSSGERQRVLLARCLVSDPDLVLLDEPGAAVDLAGRERLVLTLAELAVRPDVPPMVLVTHHLEEIPPGFTHGLLLRAGQVVASGPLDAVLRDDHLSATFGLPLRVTRSDDRWRAEVVSPRR